MHVLDLPAQPQRYRVVRVWLSRNWLAQNLPAFDSRRACRAAAGVKVELPTGRTTLTPARTDAHSPPDEGRLCYQGTRAFLSAGSLVRARPDVVEGGRVEGQQPAAGHAPGTDLVQAHSRPAALDTPNDSRPIGERGNAVTIANQHIAWMQPEGASYKLPASTKVRQHRLDPLVITGDRVAPWDMPPDVVGVQRSDRRLMPDG